jgi:hypothetical protein
MTNDNTVTIGFVLLILCGLALAGAFALAIATEVVPRVHRLLAMSRLRFDVQLAADEYVARPVQRHRHNAHCPACGRFARVTSAGDWGVRTRCKAHGMRLRAVRLVGERERTTLVKITTYRPGWVDEVAPVTSPLAIEAPVREPDWLDDAETGPIPILLPRAA